MARIGISSAQILRIFLVITFALLLYQIVYTDNVTSYHSKKDFRRPKFQKRPVKNSAMAGQHLKNIASRRTIYAFDGTSTIPDTRIQEIVGECLKHSPSAFNTQSARVVILYKDQHHKLWDLAVASTLKTLGESGYNALKSKLASYKSAYSTILFWEDTAAIEQYKAKNPLYPFDQWSEHSSGMLQINVWATLELEGLGANLQHYNVMIGFEDSVRREWNIPTTWSLKARMPFGKPAGAPKDKLQQPVAGVRLLTYGGSADIVPKT